MADLVMRCQHAISQLPSAAAVRVSAVSSARDIAEFQTHSRPAAAAGEFERWARSRPPRALGMNWWETAAACGSSLTVHALIAAAATDGLDQQAVQRLTGAYGGSIGALHSMLDSLIDQDEDALIGQASLISLYPTRHAAGAMAELARCATGKARALPQGRRHSVLLAAMASLYLSDPQTRTPRAAPVTAAVRDAIGPLAKPAMVVFALRRLYARGITPRARSTARLHNAGDERAEPEQPAGAGAHG
jgi:tetraprenyl-beta-curcumene synthase